MSSRITLAHDFLLRFGGAERVLQVLHERFPEAPIYTLAADPNVLKEHFPRARVYTSWLQAVPQALRAPLIPTAVESIVLPETELVISSAGFMKGLITKPGVRHLSYVHSPVRYLWDWTHEYLPERGITGVRAKAARLIFHYLRLWDHQAAQRPELLIANSKTTQARITKYYRRHAPVIYPPVRKLEAIKIQNSKFKIPFEPYDLIVSPLRYFKRVDIAVAAYTRIKRRLTIVGEGPALAHLKKLAGPTVRFLGQQPDRVVANLLQHAHAFVLPAAEDFGMAAVEAMLAGTPVLALRAGGATETVREGVTGEFFDDPSPEVLLAGLRRLEQNRSRYNPTTIKHWAERFSESRFWQEWSMQAEIPTTPPDWSTNLAQTVLFVVR